MADELERERLDLLTRLGALETEHARLKAHRHDREGHAQHRQELAVYQDDVRAYRGKLEAIRRERG
jgi:hypothetical protein